MFWPFKNNASFTLKTDSSSRTCRHFDGGLWLFLSSSVLLSCSLYNHIQQPSKLGFGCDYCLFKVSFLLCHESAAVSIVSTGCSGTTKGWFHIRSLKPGPSPPKRISLVFRLVVWRCSPQIQSELNDTHDSQTNTKTVKIWTLGRLHHIYGVETRFWMDVAQCPSIREPLALTPGDVIALLSLLFQDGIKPMWEDDRNKLGGRWLITLNKQQRHNDLDRFWMETVKERLPAFL